MPAELMSSTSFTYANRVNPWHRAGIKVEKEGMLALEALQIARLDFKIVKSRGIHYLPDGEIRYNDIWYTLWREPAPQHGYDDWTEIGKCTEKYSLLQNHDIAQILDDSGITKEWVVTTMGALGKGDRFFCSLNAGTYMVAGEEVQSWLSVLDDKSGSAALKLVQSEIEVVCSNTYQAADASAKMSASIPHNSQIRRNFEWKAMLFKEVAASQQTFKEAAEALASQKVKESEFQNLVGYLYPMPAAPPPIVIASDVDHAADLTRQVTQELLSAQAEALAVVGADPIRRYERLKLRCQAQREAVEMEYALTNQERPGIAGTKWAVFNAVTGAVDHAPRPGRRQDVQTIAEDVTMGEGSALKVRAFNALLGDLSKLGKDSDGKRLANRVVN